MGCNCGKPKCDGHCGVSPAVLQINNPSECVLFHRVEVPASMGDSKTNPPKPGAYKNTLLYYKADGEAFLYSSDGIPTKITGVANDYACLENKPQINGVTLEGNKSLNDIGVTDAINNALEPYTPTSELAEVAFTGDYDDLENTPTIPTVNNATLTIQKEGSSIGTFTANSATNATVNIVETDPTVPSWAKQPTKPTYSYSEITNKPTIPTKTSDLTNDGSDGTSTYVEDNDLATVATSGSYNDLTDKPDIPSGLHIFYMLNPSVGNAAPIYHDYRRTDQVTLAQFTDAIASGPVQIYIPYDGHTFRIHYVDQMDAFIPDPPMATGTLYVSFGLRDQYGLGVRRFLWYEPDTAPTYDGYDSNQSDWNETSSTNSSYIKNKPNLATVATSGSYNDLSNKPTIPAAQVNSDWNASSGVAQILNKPNLAAVATSGSYNDLSGAPNVVQTLGTSTADIMSQNAVTSSLFKNTSTLDSIAIGSTDDYNVTGSVQIGALTEAPEDYCIAIGYNARGSAGGYPYKAVTIGMNSKTEGESSIAIGSGAEAVSGFSTAIGHNAYVFSSEHSVALGDGSYIDYTTGDNYVVSVGCDPGFSQRTAFTRRIINVTNPVNAQDAATKDYVDTASGLTELSYGNSTWSDFITAYKAGKIVYCRASSNSNPATGSQGRKAFMAYVNNATTPTEVEFQYIRSVSSKTASQPVDQVYVYKLTSSGVWTVETRDMGPKIAQGTNTTVSYSNGTYTISATGGGGGGPTVVQTTGQSTTNVMSQKAVTDIIGNVETILQTLNSGNGAQQ